MSGIDSIRVHDVVEGVDLLGDERIGEVVEIRREGHIPAFFGIAPAGRGFVRATWFIPADQVTYHAPESIGVA